MDACERAGVAVHLDSPCTGYTDDGQGVTLHLKDGREARGSVLIGADGIGSAIRAGLLGDGGPVPLGITSYRGLSSASGGLPDATIYLFRGLDAKVAGGVWPVGPEQMSWSVSTYAAPGNHEKDRARMKERALRLLTGVNGPPRPVVEATPAESVIRTDIMVRKWSDTWVSGRVALLGDAAHPMLQYLAQGACMALEDAVNLSHHLASTDGRFAPAFAAYNRDRFVRTGRVQVNSRLMGEYVYHPADGRAALRNTILGSSTPQQHYDRIAWLYGVTGLGATV
jgi:2-polyprenyl-6-methoxyphenol hydroxylase-like FAD-dependent oxidoreductase